MFSFLLDKRAAQISSQGLERSQTTTLWGSTRALDDAPLYESSDCDDDDNDDDDDDDCERSR